MPEISNGEFLGSLMDQIWADAGRTASYIAMRCEELDDALVINDLNRAWTLLANVETQASEWELRFEETGAAKNLNILFQMSALIRAVNRDITAVRTRLENATRNAREAEARV